MDTLSTKSRLKKKISEKNLFFLSSQFYGFTLEQFFLLAIFHQVFSGASGAHFSTRRSVLNADSRKSVPLKPLLVWFTPCKSRMTNSTSRLIRDQVFLYMGDYLLELK